MLSSGRAGLDLASGIGLGANYGYQLVGGDKASLYLEGQFLASPLRDVGAANRQVTLDFATLYVTPGLRVKVAPRSAVSPFFAVGGGYALYEQSTERLDGQPNPAPRHVHRGALQFGGGVDLRTFNWLAFRAEIRDFYTGSPALNIRAPGGQHNVVVSGGLVLRWE